MKITELDWTQGKKYITHGPEVGTCEVIVDGWLLKLTDGSGYELSKVIQLGYLTQHCDFKEVIEPVDFLTAYNDVEENNTKYINYFVKNNKDEYEQHMFKEGGVVVIINISSDVILLNKEWTKQ